MAISYSDISIDIFCFTRGTILLIYEMQNKLLKKIVLKT
jgi:hypothetical protein